MGMTGLLILDDDLLLARDIDIILLCVYSSRMVQVLIFLRLPVALL